MLIVDTGVLLAAADEADPDHRACADLVETTADVLVTSPLVVAEVGYLIERQLGPEAKAGFYRSIADGDLVVEVLTATDDQRMAELVERYSDVRLGGTDASVIAVDISRYGLQATVSRDRSRVFGGGGMEDGSPMEVLLTGDCWVGRVAAGRIVAGEGVVIADGARRSDELSKGRLRRGCSIGQQSAAMWW